MPKAFQFRAKGHHPIPEWVINLNMRIYADDIGNCGPHLTVRPASFAMPITILPGHWLIKLDNGDLLTLPPAHFEAVKHVLLAAIQGEFKRLSPTRGVMTGADAVRAIVGYEGSDVS